MRTRRLGEKKKKKVGYSKPPEPLSLETWLSRWCPDLNETAIEQLKSMTIQSMPDGTHLIKYQPKQYQAFWQSYKLGKRLYADAPTPEEALDKLNQQLREIKERE